MIGNLSGRNSCHTYTRSQPYPFTAITVEKRNWRYQESPKHQTNPILMFLLVKNDGAASEKTLLMLLDATGFIWENRHHANQNSRTMIRDDLGKLHRPLKTSRGSSAAITSRISFGPPAVILFIIDLPGDKAMQTDAGNVGIRNFHWNIY